jgi:hypothetical protein
MNPNIKEHFDIFETMLIESSVIVSYQILSREIAAFDGKIRVKATLIDGGNIELFEYVADSKSNIRLLKYSFHWQDAQGNLRHRWDNAPHHPELLNAPHHAHTENDSLREIMQVPDPFFVIGEIEKALQGIIK